MQSPIDFSFQVRLAIARLARMICKMEGSRTSMSDENEILQLVHHAANHQNPEVQSVFEELVYIMTPEERAFLSERGIALPEAFEPDRPRQETSAETRRPRKVYRGRVVEE